MWPCWKEYTGIILALNRFRRQQDYLVTQFYLAFCLSEGLRITLKSETDHASDMLLLSSWEYDNTLLHIYTFIVFFHGKVEMPQMRRNYCLLTRQRSIAPLPGPGLLFSDAHAVWFPLFENVSFSLVNCNRHGVISVKAWWRFIWPFSVIFLTLIRLMEVKGALWFVYGSTILEIPVMSVYFKHIIYRCYR